MRAKTLLSILAEQELKEQQARDEAIKRLVKNGLREEDVKILEEYQKENPYFFSLLNQLYEEYTEVVSKHMGKLMTAFLSLPEKTGQAFFNKFQAELRVWADTLQEEFVNKSSPENNIKIQ